jgi:NDP-hexose 4-ketoreductase
MRRILQFGASGFIGRALADRLHDRSDLCLEVASSRVLRQLDVSKICDLLQEHPADLIVQGGGVSHHRGLGVHEFYEGNLMPTVRLASALERLGRQAIPVYVFGSAAELGRTEARASESHACQPASDYGRSKWFQTQFVRQRNRQGFRFSVLRLFNVVGVGMSDAQVPLCFIGPVRRGDDRLRTGPLRFQRDFIDVRDVAAVIATLIEREWSGELLHVCTGRGTTAGALVDEVLRQTGRAVAIDECTARAAGDWHSVGNPEAMEAAIGRSVTWSAERCIRELLEHA